MIWESSFWKQDLLRLCTRLCKVREDLIWSERNTVRFEKDMFISFYSIRKLIEAKKLSRDVIAVRIAASSFPATGKEVTYMNWHKLDELYDFDRGRQESLKLEFLCNQLIHSYVFSPIFEDHGPLLGILLSSDRMRNKRLFEVSVDEIIRVLRAVGHDYPSAGQFTFNESTRDYDVDLFDPKRA